MTQYAVKALYNEDDQPIVRGPFDTEEEAEQALRERGVYAGEPQNLSACGPYLIPRWT